MGRLLGGGGGWDGVKLHQPCSRLRVGGALGLNFLICETTTLDPQHLAGRSVSKFQEHEDLQVAPGLLPVGVSRAPGSPAPGPPAPAGAARP